MKRKEAKRRAMLILAPSFVILLLVSFAFSYANAIASNLDAIQKLPYFLRRLAEYRSKGNATELARELNEMAQKIAMKEEIIKSTNGAVLHSPVPNSAASSLGTGGSQLDYYYRYYYVNNIND